MAKKYKDTFFRAYFNDKTRLLSLCNALTGEDGTDPDEIEINTIGETFFSKLKNDISCMYRGRLLILIEQQSTLNANMPFRFFVYLGKLIEKIYGNELGEILHGTKRVNFPRVEFYVLYNGYKKAPESEIMNLVDDDSVNEKSYFQLRVKFLNINSPHNRELILKSLPLEDYCVIVERVKENLSSGMNVKAAFYEAYKYCMKNRTWMNDFLEVHEWELMDMISTEYDEELALKIARKEGKDEGRIEGELKGRLEGELNGAKKTLLENIRSLMETLNLTAQQAMDALKVPADKQAEYHSLI